MLLLEGATLTLRVSPFDDRNVPQILAALHDAALIAGAVLRAFYDLYVSNHYTTGAVTVTIDDSSFTSGTYGIFANGGAVVTNRIVVSNNSEGLYAGGSAAIYLSNATISGNQVAFGNFATIYSYRNNIIRGNTSGSDSSGQSLTYLSAAD